MGLATTTEANRKIFLKHSPQAEFDPCQIRPKALELLFAETPVRARAATG